MLLCLLSKCLKMKVRNVVGVLTLLLVMLVSPEAIQAQQSALVRSSNAAH